MLTPPSPHPPPDIFFCQKSENILINVVERGLTVPFKVSIPWHIFAGLPPREASNRAGMGQVDKREGQLLLDIGTGFRRCEESRDTQLPLTGAVPDL